MPEITFCLFDLNYLFKLLPKECEELNDSLAEYEAKAEEEMAQNRMKLFGEYDYQGEFQYK